MSVSIVLSLIFVTGSLAQRAMMGRGGGGWGPGTPYTRLYNPQTMETVSGDVVAVDRITPLKGMSYGIHLLLKTQTATISIHLGPSWYLENQNIRVSVGDKIKVKGSKVIFNGKPVLIAAEVRKGDKVLMLRDAHGYPLWSGWRRR